MPLRLAELISSAGIFLLVRVPDVEWEDVLEEARDRMA